MASESRHRFGPPYSSQDPHSAFPRHASFRCTAPYGLGNRGSLGQGEPFLILFSRFTVLNFLRNQTRKSWSFGAPPSFALGSVAIPDSATGSGLLSVFLLRETTVSGLEVPPYSQRHLLNSALDVEVPRNIRGPW